MVFPDWFGGTARVHFAQHLAPLAGLPNLRFLQIGAFCGHASEWLAKNILTHPSSRLDDVDTWQGSEDIVIFDFADVEREYDRRTAPFATTITKHKTTSFAFLDALPPRPIYDFAYIDGDHTAFAVMNDALGAYHRLKVGGVLAFDDYIWTMNAGPLHDPKTAIDAFETVSSDRFDLISRTNQVWLRKIA